MDIKKVYVKTETVDEKKVAVSLFISAGGLEASNAVSQGTCMEFPCIHVTWEKFAQMAHP